MTHNRLSNFYSVYTIVQVVHTKSIKVVLADYSAFRSSSKMIEERAAAAVKEKEKKRKVYGEPCLKKRKNVEFYGTLLVELSLEEEHNYNILLRMTSENFEEIFQLIKDNRLKENTNLRELIPPRL